MIDLPHMGALLEGRREGHSLPQGLYNGDDAFAFDMAAVFARSWIMIGFDCELPRPGSYLSEMIGSWPVLIVRGQDLRCSRDEHTIPTNRAAGHTGVEVLQKSPHSADGSEALDRLCAKFTAEGRATEFNTLQEFLHIDFGLLV